LIFHHTTLSSFFCGTAVVAPVGGVLLCGRCAQRRAKTWRAFFAALEGLRERSSE